MINIDNIRTRYAGHFRWCDDSMIPTYFEGRIGTAVAEREDDPRWVIIRSGDFYFASGEPVGIEQAAGEFIRHGSVIIAEDTEKWLTAIREAGLRADTFTRYRTLLPENGLDSDKLKGFLNTPDCVEVRRAGEAEYALLRDCQWEKGFVQSFKDSEDFLTNGFGFCVFVGGELASAATTYGYYSGGFELQIATAPKFRRRGLAAVAGAAFLLECLRRGKRPHWDAANQTSVNLAQRLGFEYGGEYLAIDVHSVQ